jgi:hypothetical protein
MREPRLGDDIDDYCVRCKRVMNHSVVSVVNAEPAKVRCRTCHSDHDYRREQPPPPKVDARKAALFNEVLKKVNPEDAAEATEADPNGDAGAGEEAAQPAASEAPKPAPKSKGKAKGRK